MNDGCSVGKSLLWHINYNNTIIHLLFATFCCIDPYFIFKLTNLKNTTLIYFIENTLVQPILEYATQVWDPYQQNLTHKIKMVQRRMARWIKPDYIVSAVRYQPKFAYPNTVT